jgi:L-iditol 2-dehydrogenase
VSHPTKVRADAALPTHMRAWVLGNPGQLSLVDKPIPTPGRAEVLVRIDAVGICATDLEIIRHGAPAMIHGGEPFNKMFTPGHEYMGTLVALGPGVDEYRIGQRVTVEVHAGCGQCKRCRGGMYTACLNYGLNYGDVDKGHRANGFTTDGGFAEYAVNKVNTVIPIPDSMSDAEATLVVTAGTAMYGLTELGGLVAGEGVAVVGPGPIGLLGVAVAKALGASPVILTGTRDNRLQIGGALGASASLPFRTSRPRSTSHTSCATTSTSTASGARERAPRTAPRRSCRRNASTPRRSTPTRSASTICRRPCATPVNTSTTQSRWW